jgi:hypothetical protein
MNYPEPPQGVYSTPIDMGLSPEYGQYSRSAHDTYPTTMGYDANALFAEAPYMYPDDEVRVPSSNLSSDSASSSTMGSPLSNHDQLGPVPDWAAPQGLTGSPSIVDQNDYFPAGAEYSFAPNLETFNPHFEYAQAKGPGFVGELAQIPRSRLSSVVSPCTSSTTIMPESGLSLDTRLAQASLSTSSTSAASSTTSNFVFASPITSASSPSLPAWRSPCQDDRGSNARDKPAHFFSPFFSQSSGHFVAPLGSSCWFPLV